MKKGKILLALCFFLYKTVKSKNRPEVSSGALNLYSLTHSAEIKNTYKQTGLETVENLKPAD